MLAAESGLQYLRMSWEEYLELPERPRAEWVDGEVVVSPFGSATHGAICANVVFALKTALPSVTVMTETGVWSSLDPKLATAQQGHDETEKFVNAAVQFIDKWKTLRPVGTK